MMKTMKRMMILVLLAVVSVGLKAEDVKVAISDFTGGAVVVKSQEGQTITITVTPAEGYYIEKTDMEVIAVKDPTSATRGDEDISVAGVLELTLVDDEGKAVVDEKGGAVDDPEDLTKARNYSFVVPEGLGSWVRKAEFHETVVTNLILDENVTSLDADLLSAHPNVKTVTITYDQDVISLGECDVTGLVIDVPGNLYNAYKVAEGWDKAEDIISSKGVEMTGVAFGEHNDYDTFVSSKSVKIPSVLNAFVITAIKDETVDILEIEDGIIPAGVPVLLLSKAQKGSDFRTATVDQKGSEYTNILKAAGSGGQHVDLGQAYLLYNDVFYLSQEGIIPENGVYIPVSDGSEEQGKEDKKDNLRARSFLTIGVSGTTAITPSHFSPISHLSDAWYTLDGRRLNGAPTAKGIYVFNGKKVIIR